jgi:hypothetical protein
MKLLHCPQCNDIVALHTQERSCLCGKAKGKYINNQRAEVSGGHILGINNREFLSTRERRNTQNTITAFFIWFSPKD